MKKGYNTEAHGGAGRGQNNLGKPSGAGRGSKTPNASPVAHSMQSKGTGSKKGYDTSAHTTAHHEHAKDGQAVGRVGSQLPMSYEAPTWAEGGKQKVNVGTYTNSYAHGTPNKAEHHPPAGKEPHKFDRPAQGAHGFGHSGSERKGVHRLSGHPGAHQVGCK